MRMPFFALAVVLCGGIAFSRADAQPPKQPKFLVVKGLQEDANYVLQAKDPDKVLKQESIEDYDYKSISAVQERAAHALQKIKALLDGGTPTTEEIEVVTGKTTIGDLSEKLLDINRKSIHIGMINKMEQTAMRCQIWVEDVGVKGKLNLDQLTEAASEGENLQKVVGQAQKIGFPDDYKITFRKTSYSLPELKEMGHYVATAGGQLKKEIEAARNAKDAPYLKLLKGDKLRIFKEEFAGQGGMFEVLTSGGRALATPDALNGAAVWYTWGNDRSIIDTWHITGWRFNGDKFAGNSSRSGIGLRPAAANFK